MLDISHISEYITAILTLWLGYIHKSLSDRPTRDEIILRQKANDIIQSEIKEDIREIKENLKDINQKLDQFYD